MKRCIPGLLAILAGSTLTAIISPGLQAKRGGLIGGEILLPLLFFLLTCILQGSIEVRKEAKKRDDDDDDRQ